MKLRVAGPGVRRSTRKRLSRSELPGALETLAVLHGAGLAYRRVKSIIQTINGGEGGKRESLTLDTLNWFGLTLF